MRAAKVLILAATPLLLSGCLVDMLMSTAIQGELEKEQLSTLKRTLDSAKQTTSDIQVKQAIQAYAAENGKYPASLQDLVPAYFPQVPTQPDGTPYGYDPQTGRLLDGPVLSNQPAMPSQPLGPQESDNDKMIRIRGAINKYGMATGYYPASLQQLVPAYLPAVPKANNGLDFIYVPQNGGLYVPQGNALAQPAPAGGYGQAAPAMPRGVGAGAGPMGEVLTGIGIQNELNSMSNAGSSAAGSRARGSARDIGENATQRQEQAMDNLGL